MAEFDANGVEIMFSATLREITMILVMSALVMGSMPGILQDAAGELGAPYDTGNGNPPGDGVLETDGNWTVESGDVLSYSDTTIILNGNRISIAASGQSWRQEPQCQHSSGYFIKDFPSASSI